LAESDLGTTGGRPATSAAPQRRPFVPREERERRRREALDSLTIGEWREGRVRSVVPFGAFVDLGGIDGLVHISQLGTGGYVEKAEDVVQAGQTVRVRIVEIDKERGRIGLSMREPSAPRPPRPAPAERPSTAQQPTFAPAEVDDGSAQRGGGPHRRSNDRPQKWAKDSARGEARPRARRRHDEDEEDWRVARGGEARDYYAIFGDEAEEEAPAPTTAEELVARFSRSRR